MDRLVMARGLEDEHSERAHLIGLDGRGMAALAEILTSEGRPVTGTSSGPFRGMDRLREIGVRVDHGHAVAPVPRSARLLVHEDFVPRCHPDRLRATKLGIEQATRTDLLQRFLTRGTGIVAVGGRRAGLAAAMIGWTMTHAGLDPSLFLATPSPQLGSGGRIGSGSHVVVEGDRDGDALGSEILLLLDDEADPGPDDALGRWAAASPAGGYALCPDGETREPEGIEVERFSLTRGDDWWGADLREDRGCFRFRAFHRGHFAAEVRLRVPGRGNVLGALAAVAICSRVDVSTGAIKEALEEFAGVSRGFESRGSYRGVTLVDDEARGPTGAEEAIEVARQVFGRRKLRVAFRPESSGVGPTASSFAGADSVLVLDEAGSAGGPIARGLADELESAGTAVSRANDLGEAIRGLDRHLEPGDVLVTLGAGDVGTIADAFLRRLPGHRHA